MSDHNKETKPGPSQFDFSAHPPNTLFHERRTGRDRRNPDPRGATDPAAPTEDTAPDERRRKKDRRRRIDPTTFDKQYTDDELEFMNAMQRFKEQSGQAFPTHGEVIRVAAKLGYRRPAVESGDPWEQADTDDPSSTTLPTTADA